jgi:hypothetical protein
MIGVGEDEAPALKAVGMTTEAIMANVATDKVRIRITLNPPWVTPPIATQVLRVPRDSGQRVMNCWIVFIPGLAPMGIGSDQSFGERTQGARIG